MQERQTKQKQLIYETLCTLDHPTATEVYAFVHTRAENISRATVFRVLGGFAHTGKALELRTAGCETRYDFNTQPHSHARCTQCGRLADVTIGGLPQTGLTATAKNGFQLQGYLVEFFGLCEACRKEEERS